MLNILHINSYDRKGGAETVFNITRKNHKTKNFSGYFKTTNENEFPDVKFFSWEGQNKLKGAINYIFSLKNYVTIKKLLENKDIDIIHLHGFFSTISPSILIAIKKAKARRNIKVVQTLHDFHLVCPNASLYNFNKNIVCEKCLGKNYKINIFWENCDRRGFSFSIIKGIRSIISNNLFHHKNIIDLFICPSEFIKIKLLHEGIQEEKIQLVRNPIMFDIRNINEKDNIICYFGRFSKEKNLEFLINAFIEWKKLTGNNFKLLLIGDGEEKESILKIVNQSEFKDDIIIKDYMTQEIMFKTIQKAKYFSLSSSCYEVAPMSIIEALSLDIIPIAPEHGGMKESINFSKVGISYKPNDINSWINSIKLLEESYNERIKKLREIKKEILEELSIEIYLKKLNQIYESLSTR